MGAPFPHFIASFPVNSDMFFTSAYMKLLPPRSAHSYRQDSQSNTAGPSVCRGNPPGQLQDWPSSSQHTAHSTLESRQEGLVWPKPALCTALKSYNDPSSVQLLVTNAGYVKKRWVKAAGYVSPAPEPIKTPRVTHSLVALRKKSLKWLIVMWLYHQDSYHNLKNLKKCRQNKWLKWSLSWGKGEEGREVGWFQTQGHGWITSYQTKASNSIGPHGVCPPSGP